MSNESSITKLRNKAAANIRNARNRERNASKEEQYLTDRSIEHYDCFMLGIEHFLDYIVSNEDLPKNVLEVGVGDGNAFSEIKSRYPDELSIEGTALVSPSDPSVAQDVRLTSAESLNGITNDSLGGVYGVYSIAYSDPTLASKRIDEVLAPGGIIKTIFPIKDTDAMHGHKEYTASWRSLGYDVHVYETDKQLYEGLELDPMEYNWNPVAIVVAIKPGNQTKATSEALFEKDYETYKVRLSSERTSQEEEEAAGYEYRLLPVDRTD